MIKPQNKKIPQQFLNYIKEPRIVPLSQAKPAKTNHVKHDTQKSSSYGPTQGDFSKISETYVIQHDRLTLKSAIYGNQQPYQKHNQISQVLEQYSGQDNVETIKQKVKLEYLEKKGYLKPQQLNRLQQLRGKKIKPKSLNSQNIKNGNLKPIYQPFYEYENENMDPNMCYSQNLSNKPQNSYDYMPKQSSYMPSDNYGDVPTRFGEKIMNSYGPMPKSNRNMFAQEGNSYQNPYYRIPGVKQQAFKEYQGEQDQPGGSDYEYYD